jgi:hypothetical protein
VPPTSGTTFRYRTRSQLRHRPIVIEAVFHFIIPARARTELTHRLTGCLQ